MTFNTGDRPGTGTYTCTTCGEVVTIEDPNEELPECPVCGEKEYSK